MADFTQVSDLTGFFYEIYDKIVDPIPQSAKFMAKVGFKGGALEIGNMLHVNVVVSDEGGFTYAKRDSGAFSVAPGVSFKTQDAQVDAFQLLLQGSVDYESAARASSSRKAFLELVGKKLQVMVASTKRRYESELLYGQSPTGIGVVNDTPAPTASSFSIKPTEWASMLWQGKTGQKIDIWTANGVTKRGTYTIQAVNLITRVVTVQEATIVSSGVADTDVITWAGSYDTSLATPLTCAGAFKIASNQGVMFNINAALYDVWSGNTYTSDNKQLTLGKIMNALGLLANRGLDGDVTLWVSPATWSTLVTDQAAFRRYQAEVKTMTNGAKAITFHYMTGSVEIIGHGMIKQGYGLITELGKWKRIGAQDFSFKTPGLEEGRDIFWHDPLKAGFSYRYYGAQALFCEMPSHQLVITNIDNAVPN
jgi:hypothetical protein